MIKKTAIILSGGKNSRMNYKTKAFLKFNGDTFIHRILLAIADYEEKIISCNNFKAYKDFKNEALLVSDSFKEIGPIGGIYSSLKTSSFSHALIVACDMPFLNKDILNYLGNYDFKEDALIPIVNGKIEPLCGIYKKSSVKIIESMIKDKDYKLMNLLKNLNTKYLDIKDNDNFLNINNPEEYSELIKKEGE
ncbi:molybdopterin-guanine dinucleotide biosynthesis protein A [Clostridium moniliforme]|uniref:Probable molybdenum cofactor guanylyltransferase n=1 Tax=Clostridium moniliforme TaxID=39489 RepID=A0ABS4EYF6_9CLOT|nr:molybdenum cofactor guanylyltransferase [Clostridium moniliforme]MBP1889035.1 molybdopterin-guanine dinucleotide biosynthesis protein A [Clostridium moniliforme]